MKNHDYTLNQTQLEIASKISNAAKEGNSEAFEAGFVDLFTNIHDSIITQASELQNGFDATVLAQRGVRQLTSSERAFYNNLIDAMKGANETVVRMSLTNVDKTIPETIISQVMDDMVQNHPLLAAVDTVNVTGLTRILTNTDEGGNATWASLDSAITNELSSGFREIQLGQNKLSAWIPLSQDMLELGATWLDVYVRTCLSEALAMGFENAIVTGTGKNMPIGMDRNVATGVTVVDGVYPKMNAITVTDFGRSTYGDLVARLAKTEYGKDRAVDGLILVVNPQDYFKLVMPATTLMNPNGGYVNNVFPYPTKVVVSGAVESGEAILGMGKRYFLGVGGNRGIQFSDDYKFLEDQRYYKIVAYANGRPKDSKSFLRLDISDLEPVYLEVRDNPKA